MNAKTKKPVEDMDISEIMDIMSDPQKHRGKLTLGDLREMVLVFEHLASAGAKLQNSQGNNSEIERKLVDLEKRILMLEEKFRLLYTIFSGG